MDNKQKKPIPVSLKEYWTYKDLEPYHNYCERKLLKNGLIQEHYRIQREDAFKPSRRYKSITKLDCVNGQIIQIKIDIPVRYDDDVEKEQDFKTFDEKFSRSCFEQLWSDYLNLEYTDPDIERKYRLQGSHVSSLIPLFEKELEWDASEYEGDIDNILIIQLKYRSDEMTFLVTYLHSQYCIMDILINAEDQDILNRLEEMVISKDAVTKIFSGWNLALKEELQKLFPNAKYGLDYNRILLLYDQVASLYKKREKSEIIEKKIYFYKRYPYYANYGTDNWCFTIYDSPFLFLEKILYYIYNKADKYDKKYGEDLHHKVAETIHTFSREEKCLFFNTHWMLNPVPYQIYLVADTYAKKYFSAQRLRILLIYHSDKLNSQDVLKRVQLLNTSSNFSMNYLRCVVYPTLPRREYTSLTWTEYMINMADPKKKKESCQLNAESSSFTSHEADETHNARLLSYALAPKYDHQQRNRLFGYYQQLFSFIDRSLYFYEFEAFSYIVNNLTEERAKELADELLDFGLWRKYAYVSADGTYEHYLKEYPYLENWSLFKKAEIIKKFIAATVAKYPPRWEEDTINGNTFVFFDQDKDIIQHYFFRLCDIGHSKKGEVYTIFEYDHKLKIIQFF